MSEPAQNMDHDRFDEHDDDPLDLTGIDLGPVPTEEEYRAHILEGLEDINAGRVIDFEIVRKWLLSWGTDNELPPPECP